MMRESSHLLVTSEFIPTTCRGRSLDFKLGDLISNSCVGSVHARVVFSLITLCLKNVHIFVNYLR